MGPLIGTATVTCYGTKNKVGKLGVRGSLFCKTYQLIIKLFQTSRSFDPLTAYFIIPAYGKKSCTADCLAGMVYAGKACFNQDISGGVISSDGFPAVSDLYLRRACFRQIEIIVISGNAYFESSSISPKPRIPISNTKTSVS